jgi:copper chaperone CopZ
MTSIDLNTGGMHCGSCAMLIDMTVGDLSGVSAVSSDYAKGITHVEFDPAVVAASELITAITDAGYTAEVAA